MPYDWNKAARGGRGSSRGGNRHATAAAAGGRRPAPACGVEWRVICVCIMDRVALNQLNGLEGKWGDEQSVLGFPQGQIVTIAW
jgi:hypothetical protein